MPIEPSFMTRGQMGEIQTPASSSTQLTSTSVQKRSLNGAELNVDTRIINASHTHVLTFDKDKGEDLVAYS